MESGKSATEVKPWLIHATSILEMSLSDIATELNEIDWKGELSPNTKRLAQHLSAFANNTNGGFLVFGIDRDGTLAGVDDPAKVESVMNTIGNIARQGVDPAVRIDHAIHKFRTKPLLFVCIEESSEKPVKIRGKGLEESFIRVAGQTRKMSKQELAHALMSSKVPRYEDLEAEYSPKAAVLLEKLDVEAFYTKLLRRSVPDEIENIINDFLKYKFIGKRATGYYITNLGVLTCAKNLELFSGHERRGIRFIVYNGKTRTDSATEKIGKKGYVIGFSKLVSYVVSHLPHEETIEAGIRRTRCIYPEIAIRETLANALIHQDLSVASMSPLVEIFTDRLEITSPGRLLPTVHVERLIDITPESRNEGLAKAMRHLGICEERGSGIDKIVGAVELAGLPPVTFVEKDNSFKVTLFAPKKYRDMTQAERILATYQHCCLKYVNGEKMNNTTLRERLGISESNYPMVSKIIKDAITAKKIKKSETSQQARKFISYVPYWA